MSHRETDEEIHVDIRPVRLKFRKHFRIAYETVEVAEMIIITLTDTHGNIGLGCAAPDPEVTGERLEDALSILHRRCTPQYLRTPKDDFSGTHTILTEAFHGYPAALSAVEEALLSLWFAQRGNSYANMFGRCRDSCPACVTIGIAEIDETIREAEQRIREGFSTIKLKCGISLREDIERIAAVRKTVPSACTLLVDANHGFSYDDAAKLLVSAKEYGIAGIEQPIAASDREGLCALQRQTLIPLIADESAITIEDVKTLINQGIRGINVKLMKCGGPLNAAEIIRYALERKVIVMLGCMYESNISITTALNLALAYPVEFSDFDSGHMDFDDDLVSGGCSVQHGTFKLGEPLSLRTSSNPPHV